jgi:hypothetical protein
MENAAKAVTRLLCFAPRLIYPEMLRYTNTESERQVHPDSAVNVMTYGNEVRAWSSEGIEA